MSDQTVAKKTMKSLPGGRLNARLREYAKTAEETSVPCMVRLRSACKNAPQNDRCDWARRLWPKCVTRAYVERAVNKKWDRIECTTNPSAGGRYCIFTIF